MVGRPSYQTLPIDSIRHSVDLRRRAAAETRDAVGASRGNIIHPQETVRLSNGLVVATSMPSVDAMGGGIFAGAGHCLNRVESEDGEVVVLSPDQLELRGAPSRKHQGPLYANLLLPTGNRDAFAYWPTEPGAEGGSWDGHTTHATVIVGRTRPDQMPRLPGDFKSRTEWDPETPQSWVQPGEGLVSGSFRVGASQGHIRHKGVYGFDPEDSRRHFNGEQTMPVDVRVPSLDDALPPLK